METPAAGGICVCPAGVRPALVFAGVGLSPGPATGTGRQGRFLRGSCGGGAGIPARQAGTGLARRAPEAGPRLQGDLGARAWPETSAAALGSRCSFEAARREGRSDPGRPGLRGLVEEAEDLGPSPWPAGPRLSPALRELLSPLGPLGPFPPQRFPAACPSLVGGRRLSLWGCPWPVVGRLLGGGRLQATPLPWAPHPLSGASLSSLPLLHRRNWLKKSTSVDVLREKG